MNARLKQAASLMGVWYAVSLHAVWAALLIFGSSPVHSTAISGPAKLFPNRYGLAILLVLVACCALTGIYLRRLTTAKVLLLVPQQIMLGLSAFAALKAMWFGHFADGVPRPRPFLIADQSPAVLALLVHSATIVYLALLYKAQHEE